MVKNAKQKYQSRKSFNVPMQNAKFKDLTPLTLPKKKDNSLTPHSSPMTCPNPPVYRVKE
jgi:hypothetical protein